MERIQSDYRAICPVLFLSLSVNFISTPDAFIMSNSYSVPFPSSPSVSLTPTHLVYFSIPLLHITLSSPLFLAQSNCLGFFSCLVPTIRQIPFHQSLFLPISSTLLFGSSEFPLLLPTLTVSSHSLSLLFVSHQFSLPLPSLTCSLVSFS